MADPSQKSLELPSFLTRAIPFWGNPQWLEAQRWRMVVRSQPVAMICRDHLITYLQALPWEIRPRDPKAKLDDDVAYYEKYILADFDNIVDKLWQDALDLPVGGNVETVRWPANVLPIVEYNGEEYKCTKTWSKGHLFKIINMDGATILPTYDDDFPIAQKIMEDINSVVYFKPEEAARILLTPRPELRMKGYSMPPPERIYLALTLLFRGDQYYANLLLDTPPAGVLDLIDMQKEDAKEWVLSFRNMFEGVIDPLKIGVMYEHTSPAQWIPFGRPPTDMLFDTVSIKYAKIVAAGYWLTLGNVGLDAKGDTLAGSIREDMAAMKTGYGVIKEKTKNLLDSIIPPYLEWTPKEISYETLTGKGRAFLVYAQALKVTKEAGALKPSEVQAQLVSEGFITVEVEVPDDEPEPMPGMLPGGKPGFGHNGNPAKQLTDKVPPGEGGNGDITGKADLMDLLGPENKAKLKARTTQAKLARLLRFPTPSDTQLSRLCKQATKLLFPTTQKAIHALDDNELTSWHSERVMMYFGQPSAYDDIPEIKKADTDKLEDLGLGDWWILPLSLKSDLAPIYRDIFTQAAIEAAQEIQEFLFTEGLRDTAELSLSFDLVNRATLNEIDQFAAQLVTNVNEGTKYYLRRILSSSVEEGLSSPKIAKLIREGASVQDILKGDFVDDVITKVKSEIATLTPNRAESIVNTEINRAESFGRLKQWSEMGLTRKFWRTFGDACPICKSNEGRGFVEMSHVYEDVFSGTLAPPAHPQVCKCSIEFDEDELIKKADTLRPWTGGESGYVEASEVTRYMTPYLSPQERSPMRDVNVAMSPINITNPPVHVTVNVPEQRAVFSVPSSPDITVNVPETQITNEITVQPADVIIEAQGPPIINIEQPDITVNVDAPNVTVKPELKATLSVPETEEVIDIERDQQGFATKAIKRRRRKTSEG